MAANNIYIQVDFQATSAEAEIERLNKEIAGIGAQSQKATAQASSGFKGFSVSIQETERAVFGLGQALAGMGLAQLVAGMAQSADKINRVEIALTGMLGSAQKAGDMMDALRATAAKSPFAFEDLAEGAQRLKAFGFEASQIPGTIQAISNAAAALGGSKEKIDSIVLAIGEMYTKGIAQSQQLFRQLAQQGISVLPALRAAIQKETGTLISESEVRKLVEQGRVAGRGAADAILAGMQAQFGSIGGDMMNLVTVQFTKLGDEMQRLSRVIMADLGPALNWMMQRLMAFSKWLEELPPGVRFLLEAGAAILALAAAVEVLATAVGALLGAGFIGGLIKALPALTSTFSLLGSAISEVGAAIAGGAGLEETALLITAIAATPALAPVAAGLMLVASGLTAIAAGIAEFEGIQKVIDWLEKMRQKGAGIFGKAWEGHPEQAFAKWLTEDADEIYNAGLKREDAVKSLIATNAMLRDRLKKEFAGQLLAPKFEKLPEDANDLVVAQQNKAITNAIEAERLRKHNKLIIENKAFLEHIDDITQAALDRSKAREIGGLAESTREMAALNREIAKGAELEHTPAPLAVSAARVPLIGANIAERIRFEFIEKAGKERREIEQKQMQDRIADMQRASQLEVEIVKQTSARTLEERAAAQVAGYELLIANEKKITAATEIEINARAQLQMEEFIREKGAGYDVAMYAVELANVRQKADDEIAKMRMKSDEEVAKNRVDLERAVIQETQQLNEQAFQTQNQNQIDRAKQFGELQKAALQATPAQTEAQKTAQANAIAQAEIEAAYRVDAVERDLDAKLLADRLAAWQLLADKGIISAKELQDAQDAADKDRVATAIKRQQDLQFALQKAEIEAVKRHNDAVIQEQKEVYDSLKSYMGEVWDAMTQKSTSVISAIGNLLKKSLLDAVKEVFTSHTAAALTEAFGAGHVGFGGGVKHGLPGQQPIFGADKMQQVGHLGDVTGVYAGGYLAVPTYTVNPPPPGGSVTNNVHITTPPSASPAKATAAALLLAGVALGNVGTPASATPFVTSSINYGGSGGAGSFGGFGGGGVTPFGGMSQVTSGT